MKKIILLLNLFFCSLFISAQETTLPTFIKDNLENYITKGIKDWQIPGVSVAIIKNKKVIYAKGFGTTKINGSEAVDENTLFMIGSNTKAFTGLSLAMLQEAGALQLNDKVQKWMPEFSLKNPFASKEATITDLLSHRLGFGTQQGDFNIFHSSFSRAELIQKMSIMEAPYNLRTKFGYSNLGYLVAGELIPRVINKSWAETVRDSILSPLKMNRTLMFADDIQHTTNVAFPHTKMNKTIKEVPFNNIYNTAPAGSMLSSANDMSKWLIALLNNGKVNGEQILPKKSFHTIKIPASILGVDPRDNKPSHFYLYGMGLAIMDIQGKIQYFHNGGIDGFLSDVLFIPEEKLGIVVLTNTDKNNFSENLTHQIRDAFLGIPFKNYSEKALKKSLKNERKEIQKIDALKEIVAKQNTPNLALKAFSGTYNNELYGNIEIKKEGDLLQVYFSNHPNLVGQLEYLENNDFLCIFSNPVFGACTTPFIIEKDVVKGFIIKFPEFIESTPYEFHKMN